MNRKYERFFLGALVFCLLTVLVGSTIVIHTDDLRNSDQVSASFSQIHNDKTPCSSEDGGDPCANGFCHLGHCAKLVFPATVLFSFEIKLHDPIDSEIRRALERVLDGPFQPPRTI